MKIEIENLTFGYAPELAVLEDISLVVEPGELVAVLGPSGSGKTTLLHLLAGFLSPRVGKIRLGGLPASGGDTHLLPRLREIGMVFQDLALWPHLSVKRHLDFVLRARGVSRKERAQRKERILDLLELTGLASRIPSELSGGEQQRLALARAVVTHPRILLLDEPLGALDRRLRDKTLQLVEKTHIQLKTTTIYVTHDYREALSVASRVAVLDGGRLLGISTPEELYRRPSTPAAAELCGPVTFLPAKPVGGDRVQTPLGSFHAELAAGLESGAVVALRPEEVQVRVDPDGVGKVGAVRFVEGRWEVDVHVEGIGETVKGHSPVGILPGEKVRLDLLEPLRVLPGAP